MYIEYSWNAGATQANAMADMAALAAGAPVASLSASCNKAQTAFYGEPGGWALHDAAYGVIKRRSLDDTCDKFARFNWASTSQFVVEIMELWDASAHAAAGLVSQAYLSSSGSLASAGMVRLVIKPDFVMVVNSAWSDLQAAVEFERESVLAQAGASCCALMSASALKLLKKKAASAIGQLSGVAGAVLPGVLPSVPFRDETESNLVQMVRVIVQDELGFVLGRLRGIWMTGEKRAGGDTVTAGGKAYMHLPASIGKSWFVEKG